MDTRTIFFVGKPGSGKGTQAKLVSALTGWKVLSAGEQLRAIAKEETPLARKVKSEMDAGMLIPYWYVTHLYLHSLETLQADQGVIFDGFSRKEHEADVVIKSLTWLERPYVVLNIEIADETVRRRLGKRKEIEGRADDHDAIIEERMKEYHEHSGKALDLFKREGTLVTIDGEPSPEEIFTEIKKKLGLPA